jgi:curved DNA-binding protein CbpA
MQTKTSESGEFIFGWVRVLDELSYYELFGIPPSTTREGVQSAFHRFCDTFHPDRHLARIDEERVALLTIFKRGTEAYLVLSDDALRAQYDAQLRANAKNVKNAKIAPPRISQTARPRAPSTHAPAPSTLEDAARSPSSRPFARRAEELIEAGDFRQAKLQLVMANHLDPGNEALEAALKQLEAKLAGPR